jgi:soluble lytic murein transglycosylase-like protein
MFLAAALERAVAVYASDAVRPCGALSHPRQNRAGAARQFVATLSRRGRDKACYTFAMAAVRSLAVAVLVLASAGGTASARDRSSVFAYDDADGAVRLTNLPERGRTATFVVALLGSDEDSAARFGAAGPRMAPPEVARLVDDVAPAYGLEPKLLLAVIATESGFRAGAVSPKGAKGLMQLMPATAVRFGVRDPFDPEQNVRGGARYLNQLLRLFGNDLRLALAAYNAGEDAVMRYGRAVPPYPETQQYVTRVLGRYDALAQLR